MDIKQRSTLALIILFLLVITILSSCKQINMNSKKTSFDFSGLVKDESIDDVTLTIYYINPDILTRYPWSIDNLINFSSVNKIVVYGSDLDEHFDLFKQIKQDVLIPVKNKSPYLDARLYYMLESKRNGKLMDVAMWGRENSIFVNGHEVKSNHIFYDVIMPFLPEDAVKEFEIWTNIE